LMTASPTEQSTQPESTEPKNQSQTKPAESDARITWNSPESEIKAAAVEEVPLEATAVSSNGFHDAVLEIAVNGEGKSRTPITLDELKTTGKHTIKTSIYMDKIGVKPFDIVSYNLRAQRNGVTTAADTVSPIQFVQIKPLTENEPTNNPPQNQTNSNPRNASQNFDYITAIKSAQLRAIKENFTLANSELSHDSGDWKAGNEQVGAGQKTIAEKTGEAAVILASNGVPDQIVSLVRQAQPEMEDAARKISDTKNQPALAPQGRALALITQTEQYLAKSKRQAQAGRPSPQNNVPDPFDKEPPQLAQRSQTPAGELETLAKEQARLADDLASGNSASESTNKSDPQQISGTPAEREEQIHQRVGALLANTNFAAEVTQHLEQGRNQAQTSLSNLNKQDAVAAREPAAESARELKLAADAMQQAGEQQAKEELADALRALSDAAGGARNTPSQPSDAAARQQATNVTEQVRNEARNLAQAAQRQQENGSAQAAAQMNNLAKSLADPNLQKALQALREQPRNQTTAQNAANKIQDAADRAGTMRNNRPLSPADMAQLANELERAHANIQRLVAQNDATQTPAGSPRQPALAQTPAGSPGQPTPAQTPTSSPGQSAPTQTPATSPGQTAASQAPGNSPGQPAQSPANTPPSGTPDSSSKFGSALGLGSGQRLPSAFADEIINDVRKDVFAARPMLPQAVQMAQLRGAFRESPVPDSEYADKVAFLKKIDPQLEGLIKLLRAENSENRRPYPLTDDQLAQTPAGYRPAVADYFERLSRDYQTNSETSGK